MSRIISPASTSSTALTVATTPSGGGLRHHHVARDGDVAAATAHRIADAGRLTDEIGLVQRGAHLVTGGGDEGVGDPAADDEPIDLLREGFEHPELGRHLRPADDGHERPRRMRERPAERFELRAEERAGTGDGGEAGDAVGRGLGAVRGAERVHHEHVAQRRHAPREPFVVGLLAFEEAHVLAEHDLAGRDIQAVQPVPGQPHLATSSNSPSRRATGASENAGSGTPSSGRPR